MRQAVNNPLHMTGSTAPSHTLTHRVCVKQMDRRDESAEVDQQSWCCPPGFCYLTETQEQIICTRSRRVYSSLGIIHHLDTWELIQIGAALVLHIYTQFVPAWLGPWAWARPLTLVCTRWRCTMADPGIALWQYKLGYAMTECGCTVGVCNKLVINVSTAAVTLYIRLVNMIV